MNYTLSIIIFSLNKEILLMFDCNHKLKESITRNKNYSLKLQSERE